jgi:5-methylcytosine-specific restriction endonuclease McrA
VGDAYHRLDYQTARRIVLAAAHYRCQIRGPRCTLIATTADHIVPLIRGGTNEVTNLRAACLPCNSQGGGRLSVEQRRARQLGHRSRAW